MWRVQPSVRFVYHGALCCNIWRPKRETNAGRRILLESHVADGKMFRTLLWAAAQKGQREG